ncbi:MAG: hypothetical protein Fues2KO_12490 [Fuerstiella sp.]
MEVRVYDLSGIAVPPAPQHFTGSLPASTDATRTGAAVNAAGSFGGGSFGGGTAGGMGGGGMRGGQGYFSIPTQFGRGGGGGGGGGFGSTPAVPRSNDLRRLEFYWEIAELITGHVEPLSWRDQGGEAHYSAIGSSLVVTQTAANHKQIQTLLDAIQKLHPAGQAVRLQLWWLPVGAEDADHLSETLGQEDAISRISQMCRDNEGYEAVMNIPLGGTGHVTTGQRVPIVTGQIPVVSGDGNAAYQPQVTQLNIGLLVEATPRSIRTPDGSQNLEVQLKAALTGLNEANAAADHNYGAIDRFALEADTIESTSVCQLGKPAIAGRLASFNHEHPLTLVVVAEIK